MIVGGGSSGVRDCRLNPTADWIPSTYSELRNTITNMGTDTMNYGYIHGGTGWRANTMKSSSAVCARVY